jgi:hypothetical protein
MELLSTVAEVGAPAWIGLGYIVVTLGALVLVGVSGAAESGDQP